ncbi:hypothetical protein DID88_004085 [Monilinia fructigena]|uniref:BZIP domain-containing protein n=1 Tax=Monilinia fructigena TaxID=38457 RepID=A0A395IXD6_9HELO|nr:hypothetical protein DID88_004085 [Monilinia fructigena]
MASQLQFIEPAGKTLTTKSSTTSVSSEQYDSTRSIAAGLCSLRDQNSERSSYPYFLQNQHQHLFASAPGSPATLQQPQRSRPQVPLFSQSTGSVPRTPNMVIQDMDLFDEFTAFEGGASTQTPYSSVFSSPAVPTINQNLDPSPLVADEELDFSEQREIAGQLAQKADNRRKPASTSPLSAPSGIRKRDKALPPIIVEDPNDISAMKRARNTLAARKSRQRKMQKMEDLEDQLAKALQERDHWKAIALRRGGGQ